ncbi:MAG: dienelactone hydrolase family protein [Candidatus Pedobacter colombiensis]|uniref:Dienelactone hydrolase family protein n=1 Tax=Candidatus Pedobacter colombiensis TaxID=3121371 RepID=A0AAJ5WBZ4_9SPHI|nr:dienelactone hydrolase family protein [Pedobacter sp.]WEK20861.1 MAG: dienelactone hydrolase family protein [Pedobacter sp.]
MYTHQKNIITAGRPIMEAKRAIIFIHGRGASAEDILSLNNHLKIEDAALFAPQATNSSWYPYSFMAPVKDNQPSLDSALAVIKDLVSDIENAGIPKEQIYFIGFSQGACLTLEYMTRNASKYGGAVALTGGLIGKEINMQNYKGDFKQTPVLITTGDPDPHVPVSRVELSEGIMKKMNASVTVKIYPGRPHTITKIEIELAKKLVFNITKKIT